MDKQQESIIRYNGEDYRVIDISPSGIYKLVQKTKYPPVGNYGVFMDGEIELFKVVDGDIDYIGYNYCPFDTLDDPYLVAVLWFEEDGFVKLRFTAFELMETKGRRIYFDKKRHRE